MPRLAIFCLLLAGCASPETSVAVPPVELHLLDEPGTPCDEGNPCDGGVCAEGRCVDPT